MESLWLATAPPIPSDPFIPSEEYDVVVAGAGLTGLTAALLLAQRGQKVAVLEARQVGAVTSGNTTAKVSLLQGLQLSGIASHQGLMPSAITSTPTGRARNGCWSSAAATAWTMTSAQPTRTPSVRKAGGAWTPSFQRPKPPACPRR